MSIAIRHIQGQEMLEALYTLNSYSLHPSPPLHDKAEWMEVVSAREGMNCYALYENEILASIAVSTPMTQNMRGKLFPAGGIWGVSTHPGARRKGYCRQVMGSLLSSDRDAGKVFSNLYPFRESFYERLGYVSFPLTKIGRLSTLSLSPLLKADMGGELRLQYISEAYDAYREYLSKARMRTHGMTFFDYGDTARVNQNLLWTATAVFDGKIEGLMLYRIIGEEVAKFTFFASRFYYTTNRARYLMLNWIARHIDQADRAELWLAPDEYPETWLADIQVKVESALRAGMSRVLDVEKLAGMMVGQGSFSARIIDPVCPWNEGIWHFESNNNRLVVSKASKADLELSIQALSAMISGVHDPQDIPLRGWGNPDRTMQFILRDMFPKMCPYMHENF